MNYTLVNLLYTIQRPSPHCDYLCSLIALAPSLPPHTPAYNAKAKPRKLKAPITDAVSTVGCAAIPLEVEVAPVVVALADPVVVAVRAPAEICDFTTDM